MDVYIGWSDDSMPDISIGSTLSGVRSFADLIAASQELAAKQAEVESTLREEGMDFEVKDLEMTEMWIGVHIRVLGVGYTLEEVRYHWDRPMDGPKVNLLARMKRARAKMTKVGKTVGATLKLHRPMGVWEEVDSF